MTERESMEDVWKTSKIWQSRNDYIKNLKVLKEQGDVVYQTLYDHLQSLTTLEKPSLMPLLIGLLSTYDDYYENIDRELLSVSIYINMIRCNHLNRDLSTERMNAINYLANILNTIRSSMKEFRYDNLLERYNDSKDKDPNLYDPCLALLERNTFKALLKNIMYMQMVTCSITKYLEKDDIFDKIDTSIDQWRYQYI